MKFKILILTISFYFFYQNSNSQNIIAYKIFDKTGNEIDYENLISNISESNVILFGELHNNSVSHWFEFEIVKSLYSSKKEKLIIGAEMFESDNQLILDEYLNGLIKEKKFEDEAKLWKNYSTDYKPIINLANEKKIPVIATNIPRRYANMVFYDSLNILNNLTKEAKSFVCQIPIKLDYELSSYKKLQDSTQSMEHNGKYIIEAQAIKDATMAYFINKNLNKNSIFFHFNGSYHSDNYQGIMWYLLQKNKRLKISTISTVEQSDVQKLSEENMNIADFIICVNENFTKTY
jgi:uncharacterized iron-regulated protein